MKCKVEEMRQIICETMKNEEIQKDLSPILYYDDELLLSPDEWMELMGEKDDHRLACDLPFVQLTAKLIKRNISLLIIKQKDVENFSKLNNENERLKRHHEDGVKLGVAVCQNLLHKPLQNITTCKNIASGGLG